MTTDSFKELAGLDRCITGNYGNDGASGLHGGLPKGWDIPGTPAYKALKERIRLENERNAQREAAQPDTYYANLRKLGLAGDGAAQAEYDDKFGTEEPERV
jgi:hypothetical protein